MDEPTAGSTAMLLRCSCACVVSIVKNFYAKQVHMLWTHRHKHTHTHTHTSTASMQDSPWKTFVGIFADNWSQHAVCESARLVPEEVQKEFNTS